MKTIRDKDKVREKNREYMAKYRKENEEEIRAYQREYIKENRKALAEKAKARYEKEKEQRLAYQREYRERNKEVLAEKAKTRYERNKEQRLAYQREYRQGRRKKPAPIKPATEVDENLIVLADRLQETGELEYKEVEAFYNDIDILADYLEKKSIIVKYTKDKILLF